MVFYDFAGHFVCLLARLSAKTHNHQGMALWWNAFSTRIWPRAQDSLTYDAWWAGWFATALLLMVLGYWSGSSATQEI